MANDVLHGLETLSRAAGRTQERFVGEMLLGERERWLLWAPVALALGVAGYFSLAVEPPIWLGPAWAGSSLGLALLCRRRTWLALPLLGLALVGCGMAAGQIRTMNVAAPVLTEKIGPVEVRGRLVESGLGAGQQRYILDNLSIRGIAADETPLQARITVHVPRRGDKGAGAALRIPAPGDYIRLTASLRPPPEPVAPGAWDFGRQSWFRGIGAVGFSYGAAELLEAGGERPRGGLSVWLRDLRHRISARITAALGERGGGLATALLTGDRSAIPDSTLDNMRASGLAHLLAISGLHVGLVAGIIFVVVRLLLAAIEPLALRYPIKKWAAATALIGSLCYLLLSGASIPTQRAFMMTSLVLLAVILDRTSLSMRLIALAAFLLLLFRPESLMGPSFQMSFAAAVALVAAYEYLHRPLASLASGASLKFRPLLYLLGIAVTSIIAGGATAPFAIYHFNRFAEYGLLANLAAVPLTGLWVMPWGLLALLLMPFGLEGLALEPMALGLQAMDWISASVAALPGSVIHAGAMPPLALALIALGGVWLCIWRRRWRLAGLALVVPGLILMLSHRSPDILIDGDGRLMATRAESGEMWLSSLRRARFAGDIWLRRAGQEDSAEWPWREGAPAPAGLRCDSLGCVQDIDGQRIAFIRDARALPEDCAEANLVISLVPVTGPCETPHTVIDRFDLWRGGAHAIWLEDDGARVRTVAEERGDRPWARRRVN
jgi:competence protein ComEC